MRHRETTEHYDELVLCCLADTAKRLLGDTATFRERHILGAAKFSDDLTITHHDSGYITKHYEVAFNSTQAVTHLTPDGADHTDRVGRAAAPGGFRPMYLIKPYVGNAARLEMCFDCTHYQAQFPPQVETLDSHVFQTIFLNAARDATEKLWTDGEIDASKVIRRDWWHQLCHVWTHYVLVVPWLWLLQRRRRTRFAGSWTVVNAHEVAVLSGVAAAVDLGAEYPADLERDPWALRCFRLYYLLVYGRWYRRRVDPKGPGEDWASGLYGGVYKGPGVVDTERQMWRDERDREGGK